MDERPGPAVLDAIRSTEGTTPAQPRTHRVILTWELLRSVSAWRLWWPRQYSVLSQLTMSMWRVSVLVRISVFHSAIGRPWVVSIDGNRTLVPVPSAWLVPGQTVSTAFWVSPLPSALGCLDRREW